MSDGEQTQAEQSAAEKLLAIEEAREERRRKRVRTWLVLGILVGIPVLIYGIWILVELPSYYEEQDRIERLQGSAVEISQPLDLPDHA